MKIGQILVTSFLDVGRENERFVHGTHSSLYAGINKLRISAATAVVRDIRLDA